MCFSLSPQKNTGIPGLNAYSMFFPDILCCSPASCSGSQGALSRPPKVPHPCKGPKGFPVNLLKDHKSYTNLVLISPILYFHNTCVNSQTKVYKATMLTAPLYVRHLHQFQRLTTTSTYTTCSAN